MSFNLHSTLFLCHIIAFHWQSFHKHLAQSLTHKQLETHGCILSNVAADVLVLKHQAISTHSAN